MRRPLCWTEKLEDGVKREVRVSFHGKGLRWQWKRSDEEAWSYDPPLTDSDWDQLEALAMNWYTRHRLPIEHVERIRRLRQEARR
jgi:hypothetical protein